jgi:sugar lactone lactonase YvrE
VHRTGIWSAAIHRRFPGGVDKQEHPQGAGMECYPQWFRATAFGVLVLGCWSVIATAVAAGAAESPFARRLKVQPFPDGLKWINTAAPIEIAALRGKFVLLDFWTLGCINCMHVIPELKKLEAAYPKELVVIGVHSAKFQNEKDTQNITEAVLRYKLEHPVVNDADFTIWNAFSVRAWPTLVLIDPEGFSVWGKSGEATFEEVDKLLKGAMPYYRKKGLLDEKPLKLDLAAARAPQTPLRFPGKILADEPGRRLFVADSNHNRIVVARLDGTLVNTIGSGATGRADGNFTSAEFNQPQGMAIDGQTLYVADTSNHLIRKVDLAKQAVTTIAGIGQQRREVPPLGRLEPPLRAALNSPWALWMHEGDLYIAMAGPHQIWRLRGDGSGIGVYAGNGREDIVDGPLAPKKPYLEGYSSFAQPSGLASDGRWLYVADAEGSSIRAVPFDPNKEVRTVVGTSHLPSARLFTFGDVDGRGRDVRLQHALGIVYYEGKLYIADTYNHKVKAIDPADGTTRTLAGTGKAGRGDDPPAFAEPAGIAAAAGKLYIADTNNHLIRVLDLRQGNKVSTLGIAGLKPPVKVQ